MLGLLSGVAVSESTRDPAGLDVDNEFHLVDPQLRDLVEGLLAHNPEVLAAGEYSLAQHQRAPQQRSLPDPQFSYRFFAASPETRVGPQEHGFEISQGLPWFGKRELQGARAAQLASGVAWRTRDLERRLVAELKRVYFDVAYLQEALAINLEETDLLRRFEQIALTRYSTGEGIQQSVIKVQTDMSRLVDQRIGLEERLRVAGRKIAHLLGQPERQISLERIELDLVDLEIDSVSLRRQVDEGNPGLRAAQLAIEADRTWVRRRHRDSYPDFAVGLGYTDVGRREDTAGVVLPPEDNGKDIWALTVKLNIPLHRKKIRAGISEAEHSLRSREHALQQTRDSLYFDVDDALLSLQTSSERARLYRDVLIPQAEESLASAEAAYTTNRLGFLDLLDAERVLFQSRLTYHRLLTDYWIHLSHLEKSLARPFPSTSKASRPEEGRP